MKHPPKQMYDREARLAFEEFVTDAVARIRPQTRSLKSGFPKSESSLNDEGQLRRSGTRIEKLSIAAFFLVAPYSLWTTICERPLPSSISHTASVHRTGAASGLTKICHGPPTSPAFLVRMLHRNPISHPALDQWFFATSSSGNARSARSSCRRGPDSISALCRACGHAASRCQSS